MLCVRQEHKRELEPVVRELREAIAKRETVANLFHTTPLVSARRTFCLLVGCPIPTAPCGPVLFSQDTLRVVGLSRLLQEGATLDLDTNHIHRAANRAWS
jgi:hypothetical protein